MRTAVAVARSRAGTPAVVSRTALAIAVCLLVAVTLLLCGARDPALGQSFPRFANIYFPSLSNADLELLSRWDLLVLGRRAVDTNRSELLELRSLNPDIELLAHFAVAYSRAYTYPAINGDLTEALDANDWWMKDTRGERVTTPDGLMILNMTLDCPTNAQGERLCDWLPGYIAGRIAGSGLWDGVFLDYCVNRVAWINTYLDYPIDCDQDGLPEGRDELDENWRGGMEACVSRLRALVGEDFLVIANGNNSFYRYCNGDTRENFPEMHGDWYDNITNEEHGYLAFEKLYRHPSRNIINSIYEGYVGPQGPTGAAFQKEFLLGLASTLVFGDGYFSCDDPEHGSAWWTEYHEMDLGAPLGRSEDAAASPGRVGAGDGHIELIKKRRFENGIAVVNPSLIFQKVRLDGAYYDVHAWNGLFYAYSGVRTSVPMDAQTGQVLVGSGVLPAGQVDSLDVHVGRQSVTLIWEPIDGASKYSVYRATDDGAGEIGPKTLMGIVAESRYTDVDLGGSIDYVYYIAPIDDHLCEARQSRGFGVSTEPGSDFSRTLMVDELAEAPGLHRTQPSIDVCRTAGTNPSITGVWPQPAQSEATISFSLPDDERWGSAGPVTLTVYDIAGRLVRRIFAGSPAPGEYLEQWDLTNESGSRVASGCYLCVLEAGEARHVQKTLVLR